MLALCDSGQSSTQKPKFEKRLVEGCRVIFKTILNVIKIKIKTLKM